MTYLRDHPPAHKQFTSPRREDPMGVVGVHTAESIMDTITVDTGAENVANHIRTRDTAGSYHDIVDSDSGIQLVRYEDEAYHIATHTFNRRTTGVSFACRTTDWRRMSAERREGFLRNGARRAAAQARYHKAHGRIVHARRISLTQALRGEGGFLAHGDADPARRSDPGILPPDLFPWDEFLTYYREYAADVLGNPSPTGALTMSEAAAINRRLDAIEARLTRAELGGYVKDTEQDQRLTAAELGGYAKDTEQDGRLAATELGSYVKDTEQDAKIADLAKPSKPKD